MGIGSLTRINTENEAALLSFRTLRAGLQAVYQVVPEPIKKIVAPLIYSLDKIEMVLDKNAQLIEENLLLRDTSENNKSTLSKLRIQLQAYEQENCGLGYKSPWGTTATAIVKVLKKRGKLSRRDLEQALKDEDYSGTARMWSRRALYDKQFQKKLSICVEKVKGSHKKVYVE